MHALKIINQYSVMTEVQKIDENKILLKFQNSQYFDIEEEIYELTIQGNEIAKNIEQIKYDHLDSPTVIVDEINYLDFYSGNLDEHPDWGDWNLHLSIGFEQYSGKFSKKTSEDWKNELKYIISDQVNTEAFQRVTSFDFRNTKYLQTKKMIEDAEIDPKIKDELMSALHKIQSFDDSKFYSIFMIGGFKL